eukprot:scaffold14224_cov96-Isochrysis_galbana.AAC.2
MYAPGQLHWTGSSAGAAQHVTETPFTQSLHASSTPLPRSKLPARSRLPASAAASPVTRGQNGSHPSEYVTTKYRWQPTGGPGGMQTDPGPAWWTKDRNPCGNPSVTSGSSTVVVSFCTLRPK